ncbi:uncharacterized protein LOC143240700 isoform X3 [Tachypleus tridentatus]|uniref:uncharacterized protein LOC143240700 isoform X3 n=1 Tax=Tachypleus tridentatus TaxID=6853 RepID=UPI003FD43179
MENDIDPFTKKLLERTQARRENLNKKIAQISEASSRKRRTPLTEEVPSSQFLNNNGAVPQEESPKRQCVDSPKEKLEDYSKEVPAIQVEGVEKENAPHDEGTEVLISGSSQGVRGLAALKRKNLDTERMEVDSEPFSIVPAQSLAEHEVAIPSVSTQPSASSRSARLAALANQINNWEDDDSYHFPSKRFGDNITAFVKPVDETSASNTTNSLSSKTVTNNTSTNNTDVATAKSCMAKNGATLTHSINTTNPSLDQNNKFVVAAVPLSKTSPSKAGKVSGGGDKPNTHSSGFAIFNSSAGVQEVGKRKIVQKHKQQVRKVEIWDRAVISALEAQGFTKSPSASKINYNFSKENKVIMKEQTIPENPSKVPSGEKTIKDKLPATSVALSKSNEVHHSRGENGPPKPLPACCQPSQEPKKNVDPSDLPLSARRALFEKAMRDGNSKAQQELSNPETLSVAARAALFDKSVSKASQPVKSTGTNSRPVTSMTQSKQVSQPTVQMMKTVSTSETTAKAGSPVKLTLSTSSASSNTSSLVASPTSSTSSLASPGKNIGLNTRQVQEQLLQKAQNDWRGNEISEKTREERRREMTALMNRWERASSSSTCSETTNVDNTNKLAGINKPQLLPSESSDVGNDVPDDVFKAEDLNSSEIEDSDITSEPENVPDPVTSTYHSCEPEENTCEKINQEDDDDDEAELSGEAAAVCAEIDELLDEALDEEDEKEEREFGTFDTNVPEKQVSIHQNGDFSSSAPQPPPKKPMQSPAPTSVYDNGNEVPLLHTISFYRRQAKQEVKTTPIRSVVRREEVCSPPTPDKVDVSVSVQEKIKALQEEVYAQQTIVGQASQALNLCHSTTEFHGSMEQVEGERLLLIATQKRHACVNEIQRLKSVGSLSSKFDSEGRGTLIISDIRLPLKREFLVAQMEGKNENTVHYFLCLIRYNADVIATQMLSTEDGITAGTMSFTNHITIQDLSGDFVVNFEVYALQTKKEALPHERKYHIKKDHSKIRLTPKGKKSEAKLLTSPAISSPGGPNAVRTSSFGLVGFLKLKLNTCNRKAYSLEKVPYASPLEGSIMMKVQLHAEHNVEEKGFLTMFEDVSGFGAWHRRWCVLQGNYVAYWKYPDDEKRKEPIGSIDLRQCVTSQVGLVPRDICARSHTFQLVTVRPQEKGDRDTLISRSHKTVTSTKHLLSADTKEERILWCTRLNEALGNIRRWDPQALQPLDFSHVG